MSHQALMESIKDVPMDKLPLLDWNEAAKAVNGDEAPDDAFLLELLATFYTESCPRIEKMLTAALGFRTDPNKAYQWPGDRDARSVERVLKEEAHAMKGSGANLRLWRIAKAAEAVELPCKQLMGRGDYASNDPERIALLTKFCCSPCEELKTLCEQFRAFVEYVEKDAKKQLPPGFSMKEDIPSNVYDELMTVKVDAYTAKVERPHQAFWSSSDGAVVPPTVASATSAVNNSPSVDPPTMLAKPTFLASEKSPYRVEEKSTVTSGATANDGVKLTFTSGATGADSAAAVVVGGTPGGTGPLAGQAPPPIHVPGGVHPLPPAHTQKMPQAPPEVSSGKATD